MIDDSASKTKMKYQKRQSPFPVISVLLVALASPATQSESELPRLLNEPSALDFKKTERSKIDSIMSPETDLIAFKQTSELSHFFATSDLSTELLSFNAVSIDQLLPLSNTTLLKDANVSSVDVSQLLAISDQWTIQQFKLSAIDDVGLTIQVDPSDQLITKLFNEGQGGQRPWFWVDLTRLKSAVSNRLDIAGLRSMIPTQQTIDSLGLSLEMLDQPSTETSPRVFQGSLGQLSRIEVTQSKASLDKKEPQTLDELSDAIFDDPTNLELNLKLFQAQIAGGDLEAAETTLDRVLILDPKSRYAKILLAETKINLGKLTSARAVLNQLLADSDLPEVMKSKATDLTSQIDRQIDPTVVMTSVTMGMGISNNALGRTKSGSLEGLLPGVGYVEFDQLANDENRSFNDVAISTKWIYQLPTLVPQILSVNGGITRRDYLDTQMSDVTTWSISGAHQSQADRWLINTSLRGSAVEVNDYLYSHTGSLNWSGLTRLTGTTNLGANAGYSRSYSSNYPGITSNPDKSSESASLGMNISGAYEGTGWSISGSLSDTNARDPQYSSDTKSLGLSLSRAFGLCTLTNSVMQSWNKSKQPQILISTERKQVTTTQTDLALTCLVPNVLGGANLSPFIKASKTESRSNISNNAKDGSEFSMGLKIDY